MGNGCPSASERADSIVLASLSSGVNILFVRREFPVVGCPRPERPQTGSYTESRSQLWPCSVGCHTDQGFSRVHSERQLLLECVMHQMQEREF